MRVHVRARTHTHTHTIANPQTQISNKHIHTHIETFTYTRILSSFTPLILILMTRCMHVHDNDTLMVYHVQSNRDTCWNMVYTISTNNTGYMHKNVLCVAHYATSTNLESYPLY